jgi:hypothetical protein
MKLWLKDTDRRPDPTPVKTDDRKPLIVGLIAWAIVLVVLLALGATSSTSSWWVTTCIVALALGLIALGYTIAKRRV